MIETLRDEDRTEILEVLGEAFSDHPMLPTDPSGSKSRDLATALLEGFASAPDVSLLGIRRDGRLDCVAFVFDGSYEPRGWSLVLFLYRMLRVLGWKMTRDFGTVLSAKTDESERRLELMLLGTRPECHGQGLGRSLIHHIYEFARSRGYQSVVLEVAKETPAYGFYPREGFVVDREMELQSSTLCMLRRSL